MFNTRASIVALLLANTVGCSFADQPDFSSDPVGALGMELQLEPGVTLAKIGYTITGPSSSTIVRTGTIDVAGSTKVTATIAALPAASGYAVALSGTGSDGTTTCAASATFAVVARTTTALAIPLSCKEAPRSGTAMLNGTLNVCPFIDALSSSAAAVPVGATVALAAAAHD